MRLLPIASLLLLGGCQVTVLERLPEGADARCPPGLPGAWIAQDRERGGDVPVGLEVEAGCVVHLEDREKREPERHTLRPRILAGRPSVVLFAEAEVAPLVDASPAPRERPADGWHYYALEIDGDRLTLRAPDHRRIATLIVQGALDGRTRWTSPDEGLNVLTGTASELRAAVQHDWYAPSGEALVFRRVGNDARALDRALQRVVGGKERRR